MHIHLPALLRGPGTLQTHGQGAQARLEQRERDGLLVGGRDVDLEAAGHQGHLLIGLRACVLSDLRSERPSA